MSLDFTSHFILKLRIQTNAKKFKHWITSQVLQSIRKYAYYKLFDDPNNQMLIENEFNLHTKVVEYIGRF